MMLRKRNHIFYPKFKCVQYNADAWFCGISYSAEPTQKRLLTHHTFSQSPSSNHIRKHHAELWPVVSSQSARSQHREPSDLLWPTFPHWSVVWCCCFGVCARTTTRWFFKTVCMRIKVNGGNCNGAHVLGSFHTTFAGSLMMIWNAPNEFHLRWRRPHDFPIAMHFAFFDGVQMLFTNRQQGKGRLYGVSRIGESGLLKI